MRTKELVFLLVIGIVIIATNGLATEQEQNQADPEEYIHAGENRIREGLIENIGITQDRNQADRTDGILKHIGLLTGFNPDLKNNKSALEANHIIISLLNSLSIIGIIWIGLSYIAGNIIEFTPKRKHKLERFITALIAANLSLEIYSAMIQLTNEITTEIVTSISFTNLAIGATTSLLLLLILNIELVAFASIFVIRAVILLNGSWLFAIAIILWGIEETQEIGIVTIRFLIINLAIAPIETLLLYVAFNSFGNIINNPIANLLIGIGSLMLAILIVPSLYKLSLIRKSTVHLHNTTNVLVPQNEKRGETR